LLRAFERGAVGQLYAGDEITLVLDRKETGGHAGESIPGNANDNEGNRHHDRTARRHISDQRRISALHAIIGGIECAIDRIALLRRDRAAQPQGALGGFQCCGIDSTEQRCCRYDKRELRVHAPGQSRQEGCGQKYRHQHQGDPDDRAE
jgi:hypothetical protein